MGHKTIIEINGRQFDASSGRAISEQRSGEGHSQTVTNPKKAIDASIDGVIKRPLGDLSKTVNRPNANAHAGHRHPEKSRTLVRHGLKKPVIENHHGENFTNKDESDYLRLKADKARLARAQQIKKSNLISKFTSGASSVIKKAVPLAVVRPLSMATPPTEQEAYASHTSHHLDRFESALKNAHSHEAKKLPKTKKAGRLAKRLGLSRKAVNLSAAVIAAGALIAFFAYQNVPNIKMRLAAARASVAASLPGYKPSGFTVGRISPAPGQVVINFKSNTDDKSFQIIEKKSSWNSEALLSNYVSTNSKPYQTYQEKGKTIYIYDNAHATWVDGGVWYQIGGSAQLTSDQLLRMARSL